MTEELKNVFLIDDDDGYGKSSEGHITRFKPQLYIPMTPPPNQET